MADVRTFDALKKLLQHGRDGRLALIKKFEAAQKPTPPGQATLSKIGNK
jgi:hypothetical protein